MRIVGGALSGRKLVSVGAGAPDAHLRPTTDRVRESLFNLLAHGDYPPLEGARVLDLFAGTGALGLEALSRGAERAVFIDDHPKARALIRQNVETLGLVGKTRILRRDATRLGANDREPYTHLFLDPPYGKGLGNVAIAAALAHDWLTPGALVIWERGASEALEPPEGVSLADERQYGDTKIALLLRD
ncbi:MAG: 16S rRNA (guanine(966)-N(2))-methyltransferase RsmD [Neomegalonema sp.]|nr:16S rRNA (guanine(966)-N(2))-methyltransferase RsmD [Neomegalonema sp.]